jgi:protease-4
MQFFKQVLATIIGFFVALTIFILVSIGLIIGIIAAVSSSEQPSKLEKPTVLKIKLDQPIKEYTPEDPFEDLSSLIDEASSIGLVNIKEAIKNAANDTKIAGIYLELGQTQAGLATLYDIKLALTDFKKSGKFIIAYGSQYISEEALFVASAADEIYMMPGGIVEFNGFSSESVFFKGLLDKLGITAEVFRVGEYKSAVEPFLTDKMSEANRQQTLSYLNALHEVHLSSIAESKKYNLVELRNISERMLIRNTNDAVKYGIVTDSAYQDEVMAKINAKMGIEDNKKTKMPEFIELAKYAKIPQNIFSTSTSDKIAVIIAEGMIVDKGKGDGIVDAGEMIEKIQNAREDKDVKAIVVRINSPGGSASASDAIWREVTLTKGVKPIIASMSDVAASGGYYIAMACDTILAQPNTITGSIGIFAVFFQAQTFFNDKLGITFDGVKTGEFSDILNPTRPYTDTERSIIQEQVNNGYYTFVSKAAQGRKFSLDSLYALAKGRVWAGSEAKANGLIDLYGSLDDAIVIAAQKASITDYKIEYFTTNKKSWQDVFSNGLASLESRLGKKTSQEALYWAAWEKLKNTQGIQARMPYEEVKP